MLSKVKMSEYSINNECRQNVEMILIRFYSLFISKIQLTIILHTGSYDLENEENNNSSVASHILLEQDVDSCDPDLFSYAIKEDLLYQTSYCCNLFYEKVFWEYNDIALPFSVWPRKIYGIACACIIYGNPNWSLLDFLLLHALNQFTLIPPIILHLIIKKIILVWRSSASFGLHLLIAYFITTIGEITRSAFHAWKATLFCRYPRK